MMQITPTIVPTSSECYTSNSKRLKRKATKRKIKKEKKINSHPRDKDPFLAGQPSCQTLKKKKKRCRRALQPTPISANYILDLCLLASKEPPWLLLMSQLNAPLQMKSSVC